MLGSAGKYCWAFVETDTCIKASVKAAAEWTECKFGESVYTLYDSTFEIGSFRNEFFDSLVLNFPTKR